MAIFYKHIVGVGDDATKLNNGFWTFIEFSNGEDGKSYSPCIQYSDARNGNPKSLGQIIVSEPNAGQEIFGPVTFSGGSVTIQNKDEKNKVVDTITEIKSGIIDFHKPITIENTLNVKDTATFEKSVKIGNAPLSQEPDGTLKVDAKFRSTNSITALYFDTTSDIRAKQNINLANFAALEFVNNVPVYTYNYIYSNVPSFGIIAQDVLANEPKWGNNFSLVDCQKATGENGDYMQIKESKMVYVLWKAVQELSQKVDDLEEKLKKAA